eukprot:sb/3463592/
MSPTIVIIFLLCLAKAQIRTWTPWVANRQTGVWENVTGFPPSKCTVIADDDDYLREQCIVLNMTVNRCPFSEPSRNLFYQIQEFKNSGDAKTNLICLDDLSFYQMCGVINFKGYNNEIIYGAALQKNQAVCLTFPCKLQYPLSTYDKTWYSASNSHFFRCDGDLDCSNTIENIPVDEYQCERTLETEKIRCISDWRRGIEEYVSRGNICDDNCDCTNSCSDEAYCYGQQFGIFCKSKEKTWMYIQPKYVCDGVKHCFDNQDEALCRSNHVAICRSTNFETMIDRRVIIKENMCGPVNVNTKSSLVCNDYRDQMNCSVSEPNTPASPSLVCNVNGYPTTLSKRMVCGSITRNKQLCDDGIDKMCRTPGWQCTLHKHQLCDGKSDCEGGADEIVNACLYMVDDFTCTRKYMSEKRIPIQFPNEWIGDGVEDCENGEDEKDRKWYTKCGLGTLQLKSLSPASCLGMVMLKCPGHPTALLRSDAACTDTNYCDSVLCLISRRNDKLGAEVWTTELGYKKSLLYCLPGLQSLSRYIEPCIEREFYIGPKALYTTKLN